MDQYLSTVIIAVISGVFSVISLLIQRKQDKVINKIDEQTMFIEKEKTLKQRLTKKQEDREAVIHQIMLLILDTNLYILQNTTETNDAISLDNAVKGSEKLKGEFNQITADINEISKEYAMLLDIASSVKKPTENK